jgi:hypothetical protein
MTNTRNELSELSEPVTAPPGEILTRREAAEWLRVTVKTLDRYIAEEGLPACRL